MGQAKLFHFDVRDYGPTADVVAYTEEEARDYLLAQKKPVNKDRLAFLNKLEMEQLDAAIDAFNRHPNRNVRGWHGSPEHQALFREVRETETELRDLREKDYNNDRIDAVLAHPAVVYEIGEISWGEVS